MFGAFLFGVCLPREERLQEFLVRRIEPVAVTLLMPVLFAVAGKVLGCAAGARLTGYSWRDSLAVGSLMNARGLMELIVIKIGFDAGLIGPALFTMLFAMTLVTTLMASPLLDLFHRESRAAADPAPRPGTFTGAPDL